MQQLQDDYGYGSTGLKAQIQRTYKADDDEWEFNGYNYTKEYTTSTGLTVFIIFLDTTTLAPSENKVTSSNGYVIICYCCIVSFDDTMQSSPILYYDILLYSHILCYTLLYSPILCSGISEAVQTARISDQLTRVEVLLVVGI